MLSFQATTGLLPQDALKATYQVQQFGSRMIGELGILSTISGSVLALYTRRHRSKVLEACAGALLIVGLICFGASLPE